MKQRTSIINRNGLKLVIQVEGNSDASKLVFIAHGQSGFIEQVHIEAFAQSFLANDYRVVRFDATHGLGESEGDLYDVTYDSYISDLEDVVNWARQQEWFTVPFALCGHSMGAQSSTWYAEHYPSQVSMLLPMAPVVNYDLHSQTIPEKQLENWKRTGVKEEASIGKPGVIKRIGWGVEESLKKFDILPLAHRLTMPVFMIVGGDDEPCPPAHQELFMKQVASSRKQLIVINGLQHSYRDVETKKYGEGIKKVQSLMTEQIKNLE